MPPADLTIDYLKHHEDCLPQLAQAAYDEWRPIYENAGATLADAVTDYARRTNIDTLPLALVALSQGQAVGTISLKRGDLELRPELTPWLASLLVLPDHRGSGIGHALVIRLVAEARRLRIKRLYVWTDTAEDFYAKLGWVKMENLRHCGHEITVMQREIGSGLLILY